MVTEANEAGHAERLERLDDAAWHVLRSRLCCTASPVRASRATSLGEGSARAASGIPLRPTYGSAVSLSDQGRIPRQSRQNQALEQPSSTIESLRGQIGAFRRVSKFGLGTCAMQATPDSRRDPPRPASSSGLGNAAMRATPDARCDPPRPAERHRAGRAGCGRARRSRAAKARSCSRYGATPSPPLRLSSGASGRSRRRQARIARTSAPGVGTAARRSGWPVAPARGPRARRARPERHRRCRSRSRKRERGSAPSQEPPAAARRSWARRPGCLRWGYLRPGRHSLLEEGRRARAMRAARSSDSKTEGGFQLTIERATPTLGRMPRLWPVFPAVALSVALFPTRAEA